MLSFYLMLYPLFLLEIVCFIDESNEGNVSLDSPLLLYSTAKDIRLVNSTRATNRGKSVIVVKNYTYIAAIDYHYELKHIFWADHECQTIFRIDYEDGTTRNKVEIVNDVFTPDGLACDWVTNKIYWTDSETNHIEVATIGGKYRKVLFWTDIDQPRAIALVPMEGFMFWTDWGESPKIERASMDGNPQTRKVIVSDNIFWPNGLTIDYKTKTVFWVDGHLKFISRMDYEGKHVEIVLDRGFDYPYALAQFDSKLFWTDWKTGAIHYFEMSGQQQQPLDLLSAQHPMDIRVWDEQHQPKQSHPCNLNNGGCSHLCLISQEDPRFTCACPIGIKLIDQKTCFDGPQELLLLAKRTEICLIYLDSPEYSIKSLPLGDVKYSIAVDFDPIENFIYWSDDEVKKIQKAKLDGSDQQDVIQTEIQDPDGIALDWISRNIYWTDAGSNRIELASLSGGYRKVIVMDKLLDPRGIAVASELGWLFWSDWNDKDPKVERSNLDGSERVQIVTERIGWPNGITLDVENLKIYWGDAKTDKIEYSNMDGTDRRELLNDNVPHVFGFTLMDNYIFWTDWQRRAVDRANKYTGSNREIIVDQMENVMGLKAIKLGSSRGRNPCTENKGNCSQLCLYRHNQTKICACQIDYELHNDGQTCVQPEAFLLYTKKSIIGRIGIDNNNYEVTIPITGIKQASSIDFDTNTMRIYWSDSKLRTIMRAFINGSDVQKVIDSGLAAPEGIAVDWLGLNIFWTDPVSHRIEVSRLIDPVAGYMYWSEWGSIKRANMDGKNQTTLIATNELSTSLSLDNEKRRLYWIEKNPCLIKSTDLNGNDIVIFVQDITEPVALTLYNDSIYWADNKTGQILRSNKSDGLNHTIIHRMESITDLLVHHHHKQKHSNQCATSNGGCSHLCLTLPTDISGNQMGYTCACPNHYTLRENECIPPTSFMIYSLRNLIVRLVPDTQDCPDAVLPIQGLKAVKAIDYDPKSNFIYWIEGKFHSIRKSEATEQTSETSRQKLDNTIIPSHKDLSPYDLAVDTIGRLLFWTCAINNVINITRLDNSNEFGILEARDGEKPRFIALHADKRLLFYSDIGKTPQLIRTRLDGSHRIVITKAINITAIAVDIENDLVVWAQGQSIHISNIDGENQHVLLNESNSKIIQLAVHLGWLYWIDKELDQIQRLEILSGKSRSTLPIQAAHITDMISVQNPVENLCNKDKRTCQITPDCGNDRFTCNMAGRDTRECIPIAWKCDRQKDCADGSDELDCPKCSPNQFRCQDGQCIEKEYYCDHIPHCRDKSDEKNCCENGFQCPQTEVCLPLSLFWFCFYEEDACLEKKLIETTLRIA
ncbi:hypothetical protein JTB14_015462 [Gonioctena quinquepunctata]|nr:hypothetical protein JTB14_015462 [Gonioctena quinquepunctata]